MNNNILIVGGTGLIGGYLARRFKSENNRVTIVARDIKSSEFNFMSIDTTKEDALNDRINEYDIIINLAGATIGKRWSRKYKDEIVNSRVLTTRNIVKALSKGQILFNASAVGYYGDCKDKILTENDPPQKDFLSNVCKMWEEEALKGQDKGAKVYIMRFGVVAAKEGGAFQKLIRNHRRYIGAVLGRGDQYFSSIHIEDIFRAIKFLIDKGPDPTFYNFTIPSPVTNRELTEMISKAVNKPILIPFIPAFLLRMILGEFADTLLFSQRAIPEQLLKIGFEFKYSNIESILKDIV